MMDDSWEEVDNLRETAGKCCLIGNDLGAAFYDQCASKMRDRLLLKAENALHPVEKSKGTLP